MVEVVWRPVRVPRGCGEISPPHTDFCVPVSGNAIQMYLTVRTSESIPGNLGGWVISRRCSVRVVIGLLEVLQVRYPEVWVVDIIVQGEKVAIYSRWEDVFAEDAEQVIGICVLAYEERSLCEDFGNDVSSCDTYVNTRICRLESRNESFHRLIPPRTCYRKDVHGPGSRTEFGARCGGGSNWGGLETTRCIEAQRTRDNGAHDDSRSCAYETTPTQSCVHC